MRSESSPHDREECWRAIGIKINADDKEHTRVLVIVVDRDEMKGVDEGCW